MSKNLFKISIVLSLLLTFVLLFAACNKDAVERGKYYSERDPVSYFEIKEDNIIRAVNVDFTEVMDIIKNLGWEIDLYEEMEKGLPYGLTLLGQLIIRINDDIAFDVKYNGEENAIIFNGITYRLG